MNVIKRILKKARNSIRPVEDESVYVSEVSKEAPWVYCSYIANVFYHKDDEAYLNVHQALREAIEMVHVLNKIGYNVYVQDYNSNKPLPEINMSVVFGHSPNLELAAKKWPNAYVVMYATGPLYIHQNAQEQLMVDLVNERLGTDFKVERWVPPYDSHTIADKILMIGSRATIETFPEECRPKITLIHPSSQARQIVDPVRYAHENEYFFMASVGNLLRGIPLLIESFSSHPDKILHVFGPIGPYLGYVKDSLPSNIHIHGFVDINSDEMASIMSRCNYMVYPTGSDGIPGSLINAMVNGLIPIVSKWGAFDEIYDYGYLMKNWDVKAIDEALAWSESLSPQQCLSLKQRCSAFVKDQYNLKRFSEEFEAFFRIVKDNNILRNN